MEYWTDVKGFESLYEVSSLGVIKSKKRKVVCKNGKVNIKKPKILKPSIKKDGYHSIGFTYSDGKRKTKLVHRVVYESFKNDFNESLQIDHIDFDRGNNTLLNLRMVTADFNKQRKQAGMYSCNYLGVFFKKSQNRYNATIKINGNVIYLCTSKSEVKCKEVFDLAFSKKHEYKGVNVDFRKYVLSLYDNDYKGNTKFLL